MPITYSEIFQTTLQKSINELNLYRDFVQQAQRLLRGIENKEEGLNIFDDVESPMLLAIRVLLQSYLVLNAFKLKNSQKNKIQKMINVISGLEKLTYGKWCDWSDPEEFKQMQSHYKLAIKKTLDEKDEVFIPGGFRGHHAIYKIKKKKDSFYRIEYNAGAYADVVNDAKKIVWGVNKKEIKGDIEKIIEIDCKNFFTAEYKTQPADYFGPTIQKESRQVSQQTVGDCVTRSTMEMLRGELASFTFEDFYSFSMQNNIDELIDMSEKLNSRLQVKSNKFRHNKIGDYSRFAGLILDEARAKLKVPSRVIHKETLRELEAMIIKQLIKQKSFLLFDDDLLKKRPAKKYAKEFIRSGFLAAKDSALFINVKAIRNESLHDITENYITQTHKSMIHIVSKQLQYLLKKPISTADIVKIERYLFGKIFIDRYKAFVYLGYNDLLQLSYIIAQLLVNNKFIYIENNKIIIDDRVNSDVIKNASGASKQYFSSLTHVTNSHLGKNFYLSIVANEVFEQSKFLDTLSVAEKTQCIFILRDLFNELFPLLNMHNESVDLARDYLVKLLQEMSINNLETLEKNVDLLRKKMNKGHGVLEYAIIKNDSTKQYLKLSLFGSAKKADESAAEATIDFIKAAENNNIDSLNTLLKDNKNIDVNYRNSQEGTALGYAILNQNAEMVERLLNQGADPNLITLLKFTPLMLAYHQQDQSIKKTDCEKIVKLLETKSSHAKHQEMFFKIVKGELSYKDFSQQEMIRKFIEWKINIESEDEYGNTPLIWAAWNKQNQVIKILLEHKADPDHKSSAGKSVLKNAYEAGNSDIMAMLVKAGSADRFEIFCLAVKAGKTDLVKSFLSWGEIDINAKDSLGNCPYSYADCLEDKEMMTALEQKSSTQVDSLKNIESLYLQALNEGCVSLIKKLLEKNSNLINKKNDSSQSGLKIAYNKNDIAMMQALVEAKATDRDEIFLEAIKAGKNDLAETFLRWGANIEAQDSDKDTALILAILAGKTEIVALLINRGANLNAISSQDKTPLRHAYEKGNVEIAEILIKAGCHDAKAVLARAEREKNTKMIELFDALGVSRACCFALCC